VLAALFCAGEARFNHFKEHRLASPFWPNVRMVDEIQLNLKVKLVLLCLREGLRD